MVEIAHLLSCVPNLALVAFTRFGATWPGRATRFSEISDMGTKSSIENSRQLPAAKGYSFAAWSFPSTAPQAGIALRPQRDGAETGIACSKSLGFALLQLHLLERGHHFFKIALVE